MLQLAGRYNESPNLKLLYGETFERQSCCCCDGDIFSFEESGLGKYIHGANHPEAVLPKGTRPSILPQKKSLVDIPLI
jgi:hypothetical protein